MLEKFGYSKENRAELRKISGIAIEENKLNDRNNFFLKYGGDFKVTNDLTTDHPDEIILKKFKRNHENNSYLNSIGIDQNFSNTINTLIMTSRIYAANEEKTVNKDFNITSEIGNAINDLLINLNEVASLSTIDLEKTKLYLETNMENKLVGGTIRLKMNALLDVINSEIARRPESSSDEYSPFKDETNNFTNPEFKDLPEIISKYKAENSKAYMWDESLFSCSALSLYSTRDRFNKERNELTIDNDNYFETCSDNNEKKLIFNIFLTGIMNLQDAVKSNALIMIDTEKFESKEVYPKFAAQMINYFPNSEVRFRGKIAKGDQIAKLLQIASKAGETVDIISFTKDLLNNQKIKESREMVIEEIEKMARK